VRYERSDVGCSKLKKKFPQFFLSFGRLKTKDKKLKELYEY